MPLRPPSRAECKGATATNQDNTVSRLHDDSPNPPLIGPTTALIVRVTTHNAQTLERKCCRNSVEIFDERCLKPSRVWARVEAPTSTQGVRQPPPSHTRRGRRLGDGACRAARPPRTMGTATKLTAPPRLKDIMTTLINGLLSLFVPHARLANLRVIVFTHPPTPITEIFLGYYSESKHGQENRQGQSCLGKEER